MFVEIVGPEKTLFTRNVSSFHSKRKLRIVSKVLNNHAPIVSTLKRDFID